MGTVDAAIEAFCLDVTHQHGESSMTTIKQVVQAALDCADGMGKMTDTLREFLAGVPTAKRDDKTKEIYTELRTINGKLVAAKDLPERESKAYGACRQAYRRLFGTKKRGTKKRGASKRKAGKATVTKVTGVAKKQVQQIAEKPKKLSDTLKVMVATLQAQEKPAYKDVPKLIAALQVAIDLAV